MKILLLTKKRLFIFFTIFSIILIITISLLFYNLCQPSPLAVELACNSEVSDDFIDKIQNLTNEEGHYIANHGYDHNNSVLYKSSESFINEVKKTDSAIGKAIGVEDYCSHVFRFPNGFMAPNYKSKKEKAASLLLDMDYAYIDWNCLNNDSVQKCSNAQLLNNLKKSSKGKNTLVVLMHDTKDVNDSSLVLKDSISYLRSQGYKFKNFYALLSQDEE